MEFTILVKALKDELDSKQIKEGLSETGSAVENFNRLILESVILGSNYYHSVQHGSLQRNSPARNPNYQANFYSNNMRFPYQCQENSQNIRAELDSRAYQGGQYYPDVKASQVMSPQQVAYKNFNGFSEAIPGYHHISLSSPDQPFSMNPGYFQEGSVYDTSFPNNHGTLLSTQNGDQFITKAAFKYNPLSADAKVDHHAPPVQDPSFFLINPIQSPCNNTYQSNQSSPQFKSNLRTSIDPSGLFSDNPGKSSHSNVSPDVAAIKNGYTNDSTSSLQQASSNNCALYPQSQKTISNGLARPAPFQCDIKPLHESLLQGVLKRDASPGADPTNASTRNTSDPSNAETTTALYSPLSIPESNIPFLEVDQYEVNEILNEFYSISQCPSYLSLQKVLDESDLQYCLNIYSEIFEFKDVYDKDCASHLKTLINGYLRNVIIKAEPCNSEEEFCSCVNNQKGA